MASTSLVGGVRLWGVLALMVAGCSGNGLITSTGRVRCDGQPVATGAISFHPLDGKSAPQGGPIVAGRFRVRTQQGRYRVEIVATRPQQGGVELTPGMLPQEQYIPSRYNADSKVEADVNGWWSSSVSFDLSTAEAE